MCVPEMVACAASIRRCAREAARSAACRSEPTLTPQLPDNHSITVSTRRTRLRLHCRQRLATRRINIANISTSAEVITRCIKVLLSLCLPRSSPLMSLQVPLFLLIFIVISRQHRTLLVARHRGTPGTAQLRRRLVALYLADRVRHRQHLATPPASPFKSRIHLRYASRFSLHFHHRSRSYR